MLLLALLCLVPLVSGYVCSDGCEVEAERENDGHCDCHDCGDETDWDCDTCCCSASCGVFFDCGQKPATTSFTDLGFTKWGYTNGPIAVDSDVSFVLPLYRAEGDCQDIGQHSGDASFVYTAENGVWQIGVWSHEGYAIGQWHAYVGCDKLPLRRGRKGGYTAAPGQYPYADFFAELTTEATFTDTLDQSCTEFYVVVQAAIYEEGDEESALSAYMRACVVEE